MNVEVEKYRTIYINKEQKFKFPNNYVRTTKYNFISFLPIFLFAQFRNFSNVFFLIISCIQQLPGVSPMGRYTTILPLIFILIVGAVKEIYEDVLRNKEDKKINARVCEVWRDGQWKITNWPDVSVGEIVKIESDLEFPADLLLICTSVNSTGLAYVETINLDGESNLKIRRVPHQFTDRCSELIESLSGWIICDLPNELIYNFQGVIVLEDGTEVSVSEEQMLLRGAILRNTDWICGIVIYTGQDTKIWRNARKTELKKSVLNVMINWHMSVLICLFVILVVSDIVMHLIWNNRMGEVIWYLPTLKTSKVTIETVLTFAIGCSFIIPISTQVYLEIVQLVQAGFISHDSEMHYEPRNINARAITSNLHADLGQVKYIFSDKTGTLTQNSLKFKKCSVGGTVYTLENASLLTKKSTKHSTYEHFFLAICLCPGIISVMNPNSKVWEYYSSSSDHLALIQAVKECGYELMERNNKEAKISMKGVATKYEILADMEFTSEHRTSAVVVRTPEKNIRLYVMGNDDVIFKRLRIHSDLSKITSDHITSFALEGLRTLCLAMAEINEKEFMKWSKLYHRAKVSLKARGSEMAKTADKLEKELQLLGAVACEDKLQDEVPEAIEAFIQAGIKVWMLTGDKRETAVNIGYSTKLLSQDDLMLVLSDESLEEMKISCTNFIREMKSSKNNVLIVSGHSLNILLNSDFNEYFIALLMKCNSVICFRMIPLQKALIVKCIQDRSNEVTLAVGDGANDVAMIQTAKIGVGITGIEGLQAVYAADYSIAIFKHLHRLLLVHGTLNYNRLCKLVFYIYYKNMLMCLTILYVSSAAGFSGASFFDEWAFTLYNVLLTDGTTLAMGILEQDYSENTLMKNPIIYKRNNWFDLKTFFACLFNGILHGVLILFLTFYIFQSNAVWNESFNDHYLIQGNIVYTNILLVALLKCWLHMIHITKKSFLLSLSTTILWFPILFIYSYLHNVLPANPDMLGLSSMIFTTPVFWLCIIIVPFAVILPDLFLIVLYRTFWLKSIILRRNVKSVWKFFKR